jgi:glycosyltransferase involved in cell wall biosynthesis
LRENEALAIRAFDRILPEFRKEAYKHPADLYIAHNLQALPVAVAAAEKHNARLGFDAEDFHSGMRTYDEPPSLREKIVEDMEQAYLPECDYLTAASPGIAEAYAEKYAIPEPTPILNVFSLRERPDAFRPTDDKAPLTLYWFSQTIGPKRGLEDIVQALARLPGRDIELHLRGTWQNAGYRRDLHDLAGPAANRIVSHDPAPPDEMISRSSQYDIGLALEQPVKKNREICLTNKIFTYLLAGNAVVATATAGQSRLMQSIDDAGFVYEPGDVDALVRILEKWTENRTAVDNCRRNAWTYGEETYNWDTEKKKFLGVVDSVLP